MLRVLARDDGHLYTDATVRRFGVYLDTHMIIGLAKDRDVSKRERFCAATEAGVHLMFSVTNALELAALQGDSAIRVRDFLDSIGPAWFPLELDPFEITNRERQGFEVLRCIPRRSSWMISGAFGCVRPVLPSSI